MANRFHVSNSRIIPARVASRFLDYVDRSYASVVVILVDIIRRRGRVRVSFVQCDSVTQAEALISRKI